MKSERPETGPMSFGKDWPGVFIRGDNALFYAQQISMARVALEKLGDSDEAKYSEMMLKSFQLLLDSCITLGADYKESEVQHLKEFKECVDETE